jgi:hypothetical protein
MSKVRWKLGVIGGVAMRISGIPNAKLVLAAQGNRANAAKRRENVETAATSPVGFVCFMIWSPDSNLVSGGVSTGWHL